MDDAVEGLDQRVRRDGRQGRGDLTRPVVAVGLDRHRDEAGAQVAAEAAGPVDDLTRVEPAPGEQVGDQSRGRAAAGLVASVEDRDPGERRPGRALQVRLGPLGQLAGGDDGPLDPTVDHDRDDLAHSRRPRGQTAADELGDEAFGRGAADTFRPRPRDQHLDPRPDERRRRSPPPGRSLRARAGPGPSARTRSPGVRSREARRTTGSSANPRGAGDRRKGDGPTVEGRERPAGPRVEAAADLGTGVQIGRSRICPPVQRAGSVE